MCRKLNRKIHKRKNAKGMTITEVVMASALLLIVIVPILKSLTIAQLSAKTIEQKTRSLTLAQAKLNEIKARSIYNFTNDGSSFAETNTALNGSYLCNVTDDAGEPLKTIAVSVGFDENGDSTLTGAETRVILTTLIARRHAD